MKRAEVAQLVEHSPEKAGVDSSILSLGTTHHFPFQINDQPGWNIRADECVPGYCDLGSREKWKVAMATVAATLRDSTSRLRGMVNRVVACVRI